MFNINRRKLFALMGGTIATSTLAMPAIASTRKIRVGALRFTSHAGSFVAYERNYFRQAGLDVEFKYFQAAQPMAIAVAAGEVDYAVTAISAGLASLAKQDAIKVIGGALREEPGIDGQKYLVSDAAYKDGIRTTEELDGKRYAVTQMGSSFHYMGSKMAAVDGIELSYTPLQTVGAIIGAIKSGQVDAWSIVPHLAKPLTKTGAVHIIGNVADYLPDYQVTNVFTSARNAKDERAITANFLAGYAHGVDDYAAAMIEKSAGDDALNAMVDLLHKHVYVDRSRENAAASIINGAMRLNKGAALNIASVQDQLEWFQIQGLVDADVTIEMLVDPSYVTVLR